MYRFLITNERPSTDSPDSCFSSSSSLSSKRPRPCSKQGNVTAAVCLSEFGSKLFLLMLLATNFLTTF